MKITAKQVFITKCILWILGAIIIPIFIWWRPSHIYKTDKSSIVIEDTYRGRKFEFDATNGFGSTLHAQYMPQGAYYKLIVDGKETCDLHSECVSQNSFIYEDTHVFFGCDILSVIGSIIFAMIQLFIIIYCIFYLSECGDIKEYKCTTWRPNKYGFSIDNVYGSSEDEFLFSKVFGLYITEESLIKINKFFGFDNPYLGDNNE